MNQKYASSASRRTFSSATVRFQKNASRSQALGAPGTCNSALHAAGRTLRHCGAYVNHATKFGEFAVSHMI